MSKLLDNQEEAWVPGGKEEVFKKEQQLGKQVGKQVGKEKKDNTSKMAGTSLKEDPTRKEGSGEKEKAGDGKKTGPTPKLGKVKKTIKERWESIPKKGTSGSKEAEVKLKENEVKIMSAENKVSRKKVEEGAQEEAIIQLDGNAEPNESSEEDDDEDLGLGEDSDDDSDGTDESSDDEGEAGLGDALCTDDDISDEDASEFHSMFTCFFMMALFQGELFDTSNIVVCQYDRISKARNKWKFNLKNGVSLKPATTYKSVFN